VALILANPLRLAAIDAGSNAFRLIIARGRSAEEWEIIETARAPVRLGHSVFAAGKFDRNTIRNAVAAFRQFRRRMDRHGVTAYRAVATSAAREARNRHLLVERILHEANIVLEVISGEEEARLVRAAVLRTLRGMDLPRFILDLGGGSLEISELRDGMVQQSLGLPLGTVRLIEAFGIQGAVHENVLNDLQQHIQMILRSALPNRPRTPTSLAVACGGNADTLSGLASGPRFFGVGTLNIRLLQERLWQILQLDVEGRMRAFGVRRDRAEVMGVAAIVLTTVARWLRLRTVIAPRVGVREGLLQELAAGQMALAEPSPEQRKQTQIVVAGAEAFACKVRCDLKHGEQVRRLALLLFDQLWPYHRMTFELRTVLETAATLHDCGHFVHRKAHHRHGEYLVRFTKIAGLRGWKKSMTACLVRYHNGKSDPTAAHESFASLNRARRKKARVLAGILRLAERLENDHRQAIAGLTVSGGPRNVRVHLDLRDGTRLSLSGIERKARLLERELNLRLSFHRAMPVQKQRVA
jgi:exopolyphosphatase/guanosine-5'-triphosphate,3'-diphosphate pyrophosphatase